MIYHCGDSLTFISATKTPIKYKIIREINDRLFHNYTSITDVIT